jgi:sugar (pentulose or hexulose) kinase
VFTTGGGAKSDVWNQIRANVLQLPLARSRSTDPAFGVAVLAGARIYHNGNLETASREMTGVDRVFEPERGYAGYGDEMLGRLKERCRDKGWI